MHDQSQPVDHAAPNERPGKDRQTKAVSQQNAIFERFAPLFLALILVLGFALRLSAWKWGEAYSYFGQGDSVEAFQVAVNYGHGEPRAQYLGQPNYNLHSKLPGPLWTIFCFVTYRFWGSVEGIALTIVLLNTAAIYVVYLLARQMLGVGVALLAALLSATSPWVVYYSAGIYNPNVMSLFGGLLFLVLWKAVQNEATGLIFWAPVLLLMLPQFHMSGLLLIPATAVVLLLGYRRVNITWLTLGIAAGVCLYIPYLRGDMAHGWQNTRAMFGGGGKGYTFESFKAISAPLSFLVNWGPRWVRTMGDYRELGGACFGSFGIFVVINLISVVLAIFLILGVLLELRQHASGFWREPREVFRRSAAVIFLMTLIGTSLVLATIGGKPFHTRYCIILLPLLFPLAALGAMHWLSRPGPIRRVFLVTLIVTCCANVWLIPAMYRHQGRQIEQSRILIPSFRQLETIYQQIKQHAGTNSFVQVDSSKYLASLRPEQKQEREAALITRYIMTREKDASSTPEPRQKHVYELRSAESIADETPKIAYHGHGIALVELRTD